MKLDVSQALRNPGCAYPFDVMQTIAPQEIGGDTILLDDAHLWGTLLADDDGNVTLDGHLTTIAHGHCAHCLEPAQTDIQADFRETFLKDGDPEDDEVFTYSGYAIGLEKLAMTYAVMEIPIRMLCREDCMGYGGFTVAEEDGSNVEPERENPFAVLQQLLTEDESSRLS